MDKKSELVAEALRINQEREHHAAAEAAKNKREKDERSRIASEIERNALRVWIKKAFGIEVDNTENPTKVEGLWFERAYVTWEESDEGYCTWYSGNAFYLLWDCPECGTLRRAISFPDIEDYYLKGNEGSYQQSCKGILGRFIASLESGKAKFADQCPHCKDGKIGDHKSACRHISHHDFQQWKKNSEKKSLSSSTPQNPPKAPSRFLARWKAGFWLTLLFAFYLYLVVLALF